MPESFGARLRTRREQQQVALATIADQTKIKLSLLEGLERDDISRWPTGIFGRAYIRAYASAIGLDVDVVVREFLELRPEPVEETAIDPSYGAAAGPPTRLRYFVGAAIGAFAGSPRSKAPNHESPISDVTARKPEPSPAPAPVHTAVPEPIEKDPDWSSAADLCTSLSRLDDVRKAAPLLEQLAGLFDATGLVLWAWDPDREKLMPTLARGYSPQVLAQLPGVSRDAHNATAAAFRSGRPCSVDGGGAANGALVAPLMSPRGCLGVLALELPRRRETLPSVRALAVVVAAQLARLLVAATSTVDAENDLLSAAPQPLAAARAAG
jgi:transcriptional regulator with XRE-family HTH domain